MKLISRTSTYYLAAALAVGAVTPACSTTGKGAAIGAGTGGAAGAGVGAAIGGRKGAAIGAIVGAGVGGATGAVIGHMMDDRAEEIDDALPNATVERVGEGILVTFDSGILFDVDESTLRPAAKENIAALTAVLEEYEDTDLLVAGHTDATGPAEYNLELSQDRALAVSNYATSHGVAPTRIRIVGEGETTPVARNDTEVGRQRNRRVEVAIYASEDLRERASGMAAR